MFVLGCGELQNFRKRTFLKFFKPFSCRNDVIKLVVQ